MPTKNLPPAEATRDQLIAHARKLGLDVKGRPSEENVRALLADAGHAETPVQIETPEPDPVPPAGLGAQMEDRPLTKPDRFAPQEEKERWYDSRVEVLIGLEEGMGTDAQVPVISNGERIFVQRGQRTSIKRRHAMVLRDAVRATPVLNENGMVVDWQPSAAYPMQIFGDL